MTENPGYPTLVSLWPNQCEAVRVGLRCMQRKGHRTWHRNEMPENHCVIWPGWEHFTVEQLAEDVNWLICQTLQRAIDAPSGIERMGLRDADR